MSNGELHSSERERKRQLELVWAKMGSHKRGNQCAHNSRFPKGFSPAAGERYTRAAYLDEQRYQRKEPIGDTNRFPGLDRE